MSAWTPERDFLPDDCRDVLATDGEGIFVAYLQSQVWKDKQTEEEIDSVITHWQELPELPEEVRV